MEIHKQIIWAKWFKQLKIQISCSCIAFKYHEYGIIHWLGFTLLVKCITVYHVYWIQIWTYEKLCCYKSLWHEIVHVFVNVQMKVTQFKFNEISLDNSISNRKKVKQINRLDCQIFYYGIL